MIYILIGCTTAFVPVQVGYEPDCTRYSGIVENVVACAFKKGMGTLLACLRHVKSACLPVATEWNSAAVTASLLKQTMRVSTISAL
jgi:hypothetical protein